MGLKTVDRLGSTAIQVQVLQCTEPASSIDQTTTPCKRLAIPGALRTSPTATELIDLDTRVPEAVCQA